jgi:hypothetical protein
MCAIDDADPPDVWDERTRTARKPWVCAECERTICPGETYLCVSCLYRGEGWSTFRTCRHCEAVSTWMRTVCGGYLTHGLHEELVDHWDAGYRSVALGRLIVGIRLQWRYGEDPVPDTERVRELAVSMMSS